MSPTPRRNHATTDGVRLRRARDGNGHLGHVGTGSQRRVQDLAAPMLDGGDGRSHGHAAPDVGDVFRDSGFRFEAIPDGISVTTLGTGADRALREPRDQQGAVPVQPVTPTSEPGESQNDFDNAQVSKLILDPSGGVLNGSFAIPSSGGFQRFCSNYLATSKEGFTGTSCSRTRSRRTTCSGRRTRGRPRWIARRRKRTASCSRSTWQPASTTRSTGWAGTNHENDVAIPGFDDLVVMSGDDTFTSGPLTIPPGGPLAAGPCRPSRSSTRTAPEHGVAARRQG